MSVVTTRVTSARIVRATGVCCRCDSRFHDEVVLAVIDPRVPSGIVFIELRHLGDLDPDLRIGRPRREPALDRLGETPTAKGAAS